MTLRSEIIVESSNKLLHSLRCPWLRACSLPQSPPDLSHHPGAPLQTPQDTPGVSTITRFVDCHLTVSFSSQLGKDSLLILVAVRIIGSSPSMQVRDTLKNVLRYDDLFLFFFGVSVVKEKDPDT